MSAPEASARRQAAARPGRVLLATLGSLLTAAAVLVVFVLPAEYSIDPLGTGAALGLLGLSREEAGAITAQEEAFGLDVVSFELAPFESVEYKYRLEAGASLQYSWQASSSVVYDLHAEPDGAEEGFAESFSQGRGDAANGTYVAPFPGIHGWFWENRGAQPLSLELRTSGFYSAATEFRDGWQTQHAPLDAGGYLRPGEKPE